jgi:cytochrome c peroxidase
MQSPDHPVLFDARYWTKHFVWFIALASVCLPGAWGLEDDASKKEEFSYGLVQRKFAPLGEVFDSPQNPVTEQKVALGRMLFYEKRLSKNQDISCNSCHPLDKYGVDHLPVSVGFGGKKGARNAPTVYNAGGHFAEFWDGRAADVEQQAKGPILNPIEMAMPSNKAVVAVLKSIPGYVDAFRVAFLGEKEPITWDNMAKAIGAFERRLTTPGRWDDYLRGDQSALTGPEQAGLEKFVTYGCSDCHNGPLVGGKKFEKLGFTVPWPDQSDRGRSKVTKFSGDEMMFKVPSLRNVAETAPYFHNAYAPDLTTAVRLMAKHQLGLQLADSDISSIVTFLKSLTGKIPADYIKEPTLP